jgi:hypothetical protein
MLLPSLLNFAEIEATTTSNAPSSKTKIAIIEKR